MTPGAGPLWTVTEKGRRRWSFTVRAPTEQRAREMAREVGFTELATVKRVEEPSEARP